MRILLVQEERYLPAYTGSSKSSRCLLEGLTKAGHDCMAISPLRLAEVSEADFLSGMRQRGIDVTCEPPDLYSFSHKGVAVCSLPMHYSGESEQERSHWLIEKITHYQPDVVIVSADPRYYLLKAALKIAPGKTVFIVHSHEHVPFGPDSRKLDTEQAQCIRNVPLIISVSRYSQRYLQEHGGVHSHVLSFPVYGDGPFEKLNNFNRQYITLVNGAIEKGIDLFIGLAERSAANKFAVINWRLSDDVKAGIGRQHNIDLLEPVDDIHAILEQTKILLMPSVFPETFGLAVVEAMLRGIPVIASRLGGLVEAKLDVPYLIPVKPVSIEEGNFIDAEQDLEPWLEAIRALVTDRTAYEMLADESRTAAARFVSGLSIRPFEDLFKTLVPDDGYKTVAITDAYDAGYLLAEEVLRRGHRCVHIDSSEHVHDEIRGKCERDKFNAIVEHRDDIRKTLTQLKTLKVDCLLPGNETGVMLADVLSEALGFPGNGTALSEYRRNKYLMAQAAQSAGLNIPAQACSGNYQKIVEWRAAYNRWPVIIKPPHSIASEDVHVCRNEGELKAAFDRVHGKRNQTGLINDSVIVEQLLFGEQYVLDTVSCEGHHFLAGVWHYGRPVWAESVLRTATHNAAWPEALAHVNWADINYAAVGSNSKEFLTGDDALAATLFHYAVNILDGIGIKNGPAHFELMWVNGEPLLVEVGARLHGAPSTHWMCRICGGFSQLDQTLDAYLRPKHFLKTAGRSYKLRFHGWKFRFHPWRAGYFKGFNGLARIEKLPAFRGFYYMSGPKTLAPKDCVGVVALIHPDREVLLKDVETIHQWENQDLFIIEAVNTAESAYG